MTKLVVDPDLENTAVTMWDKGGEAHIFLGTLDPKTISHEIYHTRFHRDVDDFVMAEIEAVLWSSVTSKVPVDETDIANIIQSAKHHGIEWDELEKMLIEASMVVGYKNIRGLNKRIAKLFKDERFVSSLGKGYTSVEYKDFKISERERIKDRLAEIDERLAVLGIDRIS